MTRPSAVPTIPDAWWDLPEYQEAELCIPGQSRLPAASQGLLDSVVRKVEHPDLGIPPLSTAARKALVLLKDPDSEREAITEAILGDPTLAAHILRHVNSALYALPVVIDDIGRAVNHLGSKRVEGLVLEVIMRQTSGLIRHAAFARAELLYALYTAFIARDLGRRSGRDPERCYLVGLLHDIGRIPVLQILDAHDGLPAEPHLDGPHEIIIEILHRGVGARFAKAWELPPAVHDAIATHLHGRLPDEPSQSDFPATAVAEVAGDVCLAFGLARVRRPFAIHRSAGVATLGIDPNAFSSWTVERLPAILASVHELL